MMAPPEMRREEIGHFLIIGDWTGTTKIRLYNQSGYFLIVLKVLKGVDIKLTSTIIT